MDKLAGMVLAPFVLAVFALAILYRLLEVVAANLTVPKRSPFSPLEVLPWTKF